MIRLKHIFSLLLLTFFGCQTVLAQNDIEMTDSTSTDWNENVGGDFVPNMPYYVIIYIIDEVEYMRDSVIKGAPIVPPVPAKEGCAFSGWQNLPVLMPAANIVVYGTFTPKCRIYSMPVVTIPGRTVTIPVYWENIEMISNFNFRMSFPKNITPDWEALNMNDKIIVSKTNVDSVFSISLVGNTLSPGEIMLFSVDASVPEYIPVASRHVIKIDQATATATEGTSIPIFTEDGMIRVYQLGDTNGDGEVNITDRVNMINYIMVGEADNDTFIKEVSDINGDGEFNITDGVGIVEILLNE